MRQVERTWNSKSGAAPHAVIAARSWKKMTNSTVAAAKREFAVIVEQFARSVTSFTATDAQTRASAAIVPLVFPVWKNAAVVANVCAPNA
jgi:hypothetical protein